MAGHELQLDYQKIAQEVPRFALEASWRRLAPFVDDALVFRGQVADYPDLLRNPNVYLHVAFLDRFETDLAAVQTIYEVAQIDPEFPVEDIRIGQETADKLFELTERAQEKLLAAKTPTS